MKRLKTEAKECEERKKQLEEFLKIVEKMIKNSASEDEIKRAK